MLAVGAILLDREFWAGRPATRARMEFKGIVDAVAN